MDSKRIAIVILGLPNSGKSSTFKHIVLKYGGKKLQRIKRGWQSLKKINSSILRVYFVPASPTETNIKLEDRFKDWKELPEILFVAEQTDGHNRQSTFDFLDKHEYKILKFELSNQNGDGIWDRFKKNTEEEENKLNDRTREIVSKLKEEIKTVLV